MNIKLSTLFISIIGAIVFITNTNATTMCVTDDMETVTLDPTENGTSSTSNPTKRTWSASFAYGTVSGITTCNSTQGSSGKASPQYTNIFDEDYVTSTGNECWCKMTSPVHSAWVYNYRGTPGQDSACELNCPSACAAGVQLYKVFRDSMYNTAGM